jgi:uncharacterized protein YaaQ
VKLVIGIINSDDAGDLLEEITQASFQATRLSTTGSFLRTGNTTVLVGVEDEQVDKVIDIFKTCCSRRSQIVTTPTPYLGEGFISGTPVEVTIGGATIFVVDVDKFMKI